MINKLKSRSGEITVKHAIQVVSFSMVFATLLVCLSSYFTLEGIREKVNNAVLAVAAINIPEAYGGIREGDGQARTASATGFSSYVYSDDVFYTLAASLNASVPMGSTSILKDNYTIYNFATSYVNAIDGLNFTTTFDIDLTYSLFNATLPPITIHMEVHSTYEAKF